MPKPVGYISREEVERAERSGDDGAFAPLYMTGKTRLEPVYLSKGVPRYAVGDKVRYKDHSTRPQEGVIQHIQVDWRVGADPLITYTIYHPTYRRRRIYLSEENLP